MTGMEDDVMITTICMNPCFDKTVEVGELKIGQVNRIGCPCGGTPRS